MYVHTNLKIIKMSDASIYRFLCVCAVTPLPPIMFQTSDRINLPKGPKATKKHKKLKRITYLK